MRKTLNRNMQVIGQCFAVDASVDANVTTETEHDKVLSPVSGAIYIRELLYNNGHRRLGEYIKDVINQDQAGQTDITINQYHNIFNEVVKQLG